MNKLLTGFLYTGLMLSACGGRAAILPLETTYPDMLVTDLEVTYTGSVLTLTAAGNFKLNTAGGDYDTTYADASFDLSADIDAGGTLLAPGSLSIKDTDMNPLLSGSVTDFDYQHSAPITLFDFHVTGLTGDLAPLYGNGALIETTTTLDNTFTGSFSSDFTATALADTRAVVPVPPAIWLLGSGLIGLVAVARRRPTRARAIA